MSCILEILVSLTGDQLDFIALSPEFFKAPIKEGMNLL